MASTGDRPEPSELGRVIASRRRELAMSRSDLVEASGLSYPYVSQLETGRRTPSRKSVARLADALRLDADALDALIPLDEDAPAAMRRGRTGGTWQPNPAYAAAPKAAPAALRSSPASAATPDDALASVLDAVRHLPPRQRLDVLTEAQRRTLDEM